MYNSLDTLRVCILPWILRALPAHTQPTPHRHYRQHHHRTTFCLGHHLLPIGDESFIVKADPAFPEFDATCTGGPCGLSIKLTPPPPIHAGYHGPFFLRFLVIIVLSAHTY